MGHKMDDRHNNSFHMFLAQHISHRHTATNRFKTKFKLKGGRVKPKKKQPENQECIPVGCVPSAAVAVSPRGGLPQCMLGYQPPPRTRHPPQEQTPLGPGTPQNQAHPSPGTRHPSCGQTHTCKNITFATSLRTITRILYRCLLRRSLPCSVKPKRSGAMLLLTLLDPQ